MPDAYLFSEDDVKALAKLLRDNEQTVSYTQRRPRHHVEDAKSSDIYVARTPADGIPALVPGLSTGTGSAAAMEGIPGHAECAVYRIRESTCTGTNASCYPSIESVEAEKTVWNLSLEDVPGDQWIIIGKDKSGKWQILGGAGGSGAVSVTVLFFISNQPTFISCPELLTSGSTCPPQFFIGIVQRYDVTCSQWVDGECCLVFDQESRRLEIGRRYFPAHQVGATDQGLTAQAAPIGAPCTDMPSGTPLYCVSDPPPTRWILVQEEFGSLCTTSTGTGPLGSTSATPSGESSNLVLYRGRAENWNPYTCLWETVEEDVMVADIHGCPLTEEVSRHIEATWSQMLPNTLLDHITGTGTTTDRVQCTPLYFHDKRKKSGVADVRCESGITHVYAYHDCGEVVFSHSAGCCDCSSTGTGTGTGTHQAPCCGRTLAATLFASVPGVGTITLTYDGHQYWTGGPTAMPCGLNLYLRFAQGGVNDNLCGVLEYSCDGVNWTPTFSPVGTVDDCGPPYISRPFDGMAFNAGAGCAFPNFCADINGTVVSE